MKIYLIGIEFKTGNGITVKEFADYLQDSSGDSHKVKAYPREIYVEDFDDDIVVAALLSIKNKKKYLTLDDDTGRRVITAKEFKGKAIESNFIAFSTTSGRGLYFHYHNSFAINQSQAFFRILYNNLKDRLVAESVTSWEEQHQRRATGNRFRQISRRYKGALQLDILPKRGQFDKTLAELEEISAFNFHYQKILSARDELRPLAKVAKTQRISMSFNPESSKKARIDAITKSIKQASIPRGQVLGKRSDGTTRSIKINANPNVFEEWDYDDVAAHMEVDIDDLPSSEICAEMVSVMRDYTSFFRLPSQ